MPQSESDIDYAKVFSIIERSDDPVAALEAFVSQEREHAAGREPHAYVIELRCNPGLTSERWITDRDSERHDTFQDALDEWFECIQDGHSPSNVRISSLTLVPPPYEKHFTVPGGLVDQLLEDES